MRGLRGGGRAARRGEGGSWRQQGRVRGGRPSLPGGLEWHACMHAICPSCTPPVWAPHPLDPPTPPTHSCTPPCSFFNEFGRAADANDQLRSCVPRAVDDLHPVRALALLRAIPDEVREPPCLLALLVFGCVFVCVRARSRCCTPSPTSRAPPVCARARSSRSRVSTAPTPNRASTCPPVAVLPRTPSCLTKPSAQSSSS